MKKVALIVGHKQSSPGAKNDNFGTTEFQFNGWLAYAISSILTDKNIDHEVIHRDTYRGLPGKVNATGADIALSLHCNAFDDNPHGSEVLYYHTSKKGRLLAAFMQKEITDCLGFPDRGLKPCKYDHEGKAGDRGGYLLQKTKMPCVIVEPFFIDSDTSLQLALDRMDELAQAYADGICGYLEYDSKCEG